MCGKQIDIEHNKFGGCFGSGRQSPIYEDYDQYQVDSYKAERNGWLGHKQQTCYENAGTSQKNQRKLGNYDDASFDLSQGVSKELILMIDLEVLPKILEIGLNRAESGGMFGFNERENVKIVREYCFDETCKRTSVTFTPDVQFLNKVLKIWNKDGVRLMGFVHSHPGMMGTPSNGDLIYAKRILDYNHDMDVLWLPIINTIPNSGALTLTPWGVERIKRSRWPFLSSDPNVRLTPGKIMIVANDSDSKQVTRELRVGEHRFQVKLNVELEKIHFPVELPRTRRTFGYPYQTPIKAESTPLRENCKELKQTVHTDDRLYNDINEVAACNTTRESNDVASGDNTSDDFNKGKTQMYKFSFNKAQTFERVQAAYDMSAMRNSRIVAIGAGGAADCLETIARTGVEQFVIIDPDVVSETNLATQQTYRKDIGRPKVECIKERILDVNPDAVVVVYQKYLDDLSDEEMKILLNDDLNGRQTKRTILCGFTDSFPAQARVNRLALKYGVPSLCAQVYREGRGAEITFTYPGVTPACHRCILSSRYKWYAEGNTNDVVSNGTPFFATTRLNAIKGFVLLALLHHGTDHPRWGKTLEQIGDRNLLQIRMTPDFGKDVFGNPDLDPFAALNDSGKDFLFFDETIWKREQPESVVNGYEYNCPDCGGTGNLYDAVGKFADTRVAL